MVLSSSALRNCTARVASCSRNSRWCRRAVALPRRTRPRVVVRAAPPSGGGDPERESSSAAPGDGGGTQSTRLRKMLEQLSAAGLTPQKAKAVLKAWSELGAQDPEKLRALLVERRLATWRGMLVQTLLDVLVCGGGYFIGRASSESNIPGSIVISLAGYFIACYYLLQAVFQVTALTSISVAAKKYSTDTDVLLAAVRELAGPDQQGLFPSASLVVNTLKVIQTLEQIGEQLQVLGSDGSLKGSLSNLGAFLALQRAEEKFGFVPERYGLSEAEAANIAGVFDRFDTNDDGQLEQSELRNLCSQLGSEISEPEAKEAVRLLDAGATGFIQFADFVEWFMGRRPSREAKEQAASAQATAE